MRFGKIGKLAIAVTAAVCMMCGCSKNGGGSENEAGIPAGEILDKIVETQTDFPESLTEGSHSSGDEKEGWGDTFSYLYDFPADKVESYAIIYSTETTADEITVVTLKNASDSEAMKKAMEDRLKRRTATFENYGPEEVSKLKKAVIRENGRYLALIISAQPEDAAKAFDSACG